MAQPQRQICPLCAHDDAVKVARVDGEWLMYCEDESHPLFEWRPTVSAAPVPGRWGIAEQLGVYDVLRGCVDNTIAEYGVIEHRFSVAAPETYEYLVKHYGHTAIAPSKYTASAFLGGALGQLWREDLVAGIWVPATGYWSYNGRVGAYATAETFEDGGDVLTWADFAAGKGIDPDAWPPTADFA
jgi:hypothetical protein